MKESIKDPSSVWCALGKPKLKTTINHDNNDLNKRGKVAKVAIRENQVIGISSQSTLWDIGSCYMLKTIICHQDRIHSVQYYARKHVLLELVR